MSIKFSHPQIQTKHKPEKHTLNDCLLLLCDLSGKIVFSKGDPKVLELPTTSYLHKNFFSFNFTLHSRLLLTARLNFDLYKEGHREQFQLELVKNNSQLDPKFLQKTSKIPLQRLNKILLKQIKLLNVSASCVHVAFKKINQINKKKCQIQCLGFEKVKEKTQQFENYDKLLMFEIDSIIQRRQNDQDAFKLSAAKINERLIDISYCQNNTISRTEEQGKGLTSAFSLYSFEDIALPVKRSADKEEEWVDLLDRKKEEEGYLTRLRKKMKISDEVKEQDLGRMIEEDDFLNMEDNKQQ